MPPHPSVRREEMQVAAGKRLVGVASEDRCTSWRHTRESSTFACECSMSRRDWVSPPQFQLSNCRDRHAFVLDLSWRLARAEGEGRRPGEGGEEDGCCWGEGGLVAGALPRCREETSGRTEAGAVVVEELAAVWERRVMWWEVGGVDGSLEGPADFSEAAGVSTCMGHSSSNL